MSSSVRILIADNNYLSRKGLHLVLGSRKGLKIVGEVTNTMDLLEAVVSLRPEMIIIDPSCGTFVPDTLQQVLKAHPQVQILAITGPQPRMVISRALQSGVKSYLLRECDEIEILEAVSKTSRGERFVCGQLLELLMTDGDTAQPAGCDGITLTDREMEIMALIAEGYSNKQIADMLFLSAHTVTTHRKNIMSKLQVNNTAGLVMFAVRNNLLGSNRYLFSSNN